MAGKKTFRRERSILIKCSDVEFELIEQAAAAAGVTKTEFVRNAAKRLADKASGEVG